VDLLSLFCPRRRSIPRRHRIPRKAKPAIFRNGFANSFRRKGRPEVWTRAAKPRSRFKSGRRLQPFSAVVGRSVNQIVNQAVPSDRIGKHWATYR
jgi:hypothetical protein